MDTFNSHDDRNNGKTLTLNFCTLVVSQIQSIVREIAPEKYGVGQVPVTISTFTNERKLYLSPGVNMRATHPESLRNPILPNPRKTEMEYKGA